MVDQHADDGFERPVSPRPVFQADPVSQATPVRGDTTIRRPAWSGPPGARTASRFDRPADRYEIPAPEPEARVFRFPWKRMIAWTIALVIVGVGAGWAYVRFWYDPLPDQDTIVEPSQTQGPRFARADEVVRQYLEALAAGDTATAMSMGPLGAGSTAAIRPDAYARSLASFPISDIRVPQVDSATTEVAASYRIGGQDVQTRFRVTRDDTGSWQLAASTVQVEFRNPNAQELPILLNDTAVPGGGLAELLPGRYQVGTGLPLITYPANNELTITNLEYQGQVQRVLTPELTDQGKQALLDAGRETLQACMNAGTLQPEGCPNSIVPSYPYDPASVRWELVNSPFADAVPALDPADQTVGQLSVVLQFAVSFTYTDGSTNGRQLLAPVSAGLSGSLLVDDADDFEVAWTTAGA
ncbi:hypothetical protein GCM10009785_06100 [Brooklawnia cerclae]|uniref:Uncharacterized protein n=1 Tax=Brooklawnia cerclae TaxID=349934 RepID=A0ABX0SGS7_9ACTN|nr:hypothetical protein [Brooklawnia cerclae]NIH55796.1 hypothetical protein [Brooklawnia cerclae]